MKNSSKNNYLLKNTIILSIGNFGSKLITFFLVPLYTNILTKSEYGTIDLITILTTVIVPLITLNIQEAVLRYSMDKESNKSKILSIGILILFISFFICILGYPLLKLFNATSSYAFLLVLYTMFFISSQLFLCYLRGCERLIDYSIISVIQTLIIAIINFYFIAVLKLGIKGYIIAYIIAYFVSTLLCLIKGNIISELKKFRVDNNLFKEMTKYSIILIPNSLMWWIMNSLDRIMVTSMINIDSNGLYAVSYKIPTILITFTSIFNQAWMFSAVKEKDSKDKNEYTNVIYSSLFNVIVVASLFLILILKPLMTIYVGKEFYDAWLYTPPLIIGTIFLTLGTFLSNEYTSNKDSMGFLKSSTFGAVINLVLNFVLIPKIGIMGAAIATCISYAAVLIFRIFDTRKYVKLKIIDLKKVILFLLLVISVILLYVVDGISLYILLLILFVIELLINLKFWLNIICNIFLKIIRKGVK